LEDEEEHFADVPEDYEGGGGGVVRPPTDESPQQGRYDARKRNPEHSNADRSALWDLLPFLAHFHPSVSVFADALAYSAPMPPKPDPTHHTLMHFLDRFIYRNAKSKGAPTRGASIMQPLSGSNAADLLIKSRDDGRNKTPLNSEAFWKKNVADVAADEVFFHSYFNQTNKSRPSKKKQQKTTEVDESDEEEMEEDAIWQALVKSKPEVDGPDDDDDISLGDLESAYDGSDVDDEGDAGVKIADFPDEEEGGVDVEVENEELDGDDMLDLESGDEGMLGDDDDVPYDFAALDGITRNEDEQDEDDEKDKKGGNKKRRKLKQLPTFASAEDYAKMLDDEPDEEY